jgi:Protein of unknown function (DUF1559)
MPLPSPPIPPDQPAVDADVRPPSADKTARGRWRMRRWCYSGAAIMSLVTCGYLLVLAVLGAREDACKSQCKSHLKQIGLGLVNYCDTYGCYPPPYVADESGRPMHSWRVLILPFIDENELYGRYRFDEPWNGPNNRRLHDTAIRMFSCPTEHARANSIYTSYLAIVGPETLWPEGRVVSTPDVVDGTGNTLMVVEVINSGVHWLEPRDLHVLQMAPTINSHSGKGISSPHKRGAHAAFADDSVRFLDEQTTATMLRGWITRDGGESPGGF